MIRNLVRLIALMGLLGVSPALSGVTLAQEAPQDFIPLFDGQSLDDWEKAGGGATYRVEDGCIVGEVGPGANTFLKTRKTYGDFILQLDAKLDVPGNSGIQFRSHQRDGNGRVFGYQCEIDPSDRAWTGGIYDEARRGWLYPLEGHPQAQKAYRQGEWNHFVIEARGPWLRTWVNDTPCADLLDAEDMEGFIALQVHAGKEGRIRWKKIYIKPLGIRRWEPLWNGKTLDGWKTIGGGEWAVKDGTIRGTSSQGEARHGLLISDETFENLAIRLKFKANQGNSGLYFRCVEGGNAGVLGLQAEITPAEDVGGLYETGGRGWIAKPDAKTVAKALKPNDWNEMSVVALGNRVVVFLNGQRMSEISDEKGRTTGHIALQLHGGQDMDVRFKDIEMLNLKDLQTSE